MPDIFDTLEEEPKADIFDQITATPLSEFELNEPETAPKQIEGAPVTPTPAAAQPTSTTTAWQAVNTPLTKAAGIPFRPIANALVDMPFQLAGVPPRTASSALDAASKKFPVVEAFREGEENMGESTLSPLSIATLAGGGLLAKAPSWAQRVLSGAFAAQGAIQGAESYYRMYKAAKAGDWPAAVKEAVQGTGGAAQAALGAHGAVARVPEAIGTAKPPVIPTAELPPDLAAAANALPRAAAEVAKIQPQPPTAEVSDASSQQETAKVDGDVQPQPGSSPGQVPAPESSGGVQPQTAGRVQEGTETPPPGPQPETLRPAVSRAAEIAQHPLDKPFPKTAYTEEALRYGAGLDPNKPEQLKELQDLLTKAKSEEQAIPMTNPDGSVNEANWNKRQIAHSKSHWLTEALQAATGLDERDAAKELLGKDYKPPFPAKPPEPNAPVAGKPIEPPQQASLLDQLRTNPKVRAQHGVHLDLAENAESRIPTIMSEGLKSGYLNDISDAGKLGWTEMPMSGPRGTKAGDVAYIVKQKGLRVKRGTKPVAVVRFTRDGQTLFEAMEEAAKPAEAPKPAEPVKPSRRIPSYTRPPDVLDALESTGKINIASARAIRKGYNPPAAAREYFDFQNKSSGIDKVLQGVQNSASGEFTRLQSEDDLLDAIDRAGPARQAMRNAPSAEARQAEADVKANKGKQPIPAGPGAATRPDLVAGGPDLPTDPGNPDVYGVAARVREERAKAGQVVPVPPGQGIGAEESLEHGRMLLERGADAEARMAQFEKDGRVSASDMAVARAQGEKLAQDARNIEEKFGTDSDEYRAAWKALSDWDTRSKAMQTEWHRTGQAQQGETDLDTGSFTGLQRAYKDATGEEFTPGEAARAQEHARKVKSADEQAKAAQDELFKNLPQQKPAKPGAADDPRSDGNVWKKVRDYIEQGEDDYKEVLAKVATDLAMPYEDVAKAIARNKTTKRLADDVWAKQLTARRMKEQARRFLAQTAIPTLQRNLAKIPRIMFGLKVGFHGTVALGTHAPMVAFQPPFWASYFRGFGKMYRMVNPIGNRGQAYYEMQVQSLLHRPNFITARRAGLVNDPFTYEDYNSPDVAKYIGNISGMGNRGYFVLKILRQDMFDQHWNSLPDSLKTPEVASAIADDLNHATGVTKAMAPKGANLALFAPRLEASRVAWLAMDPAKAGATLANWRNATEAQKWAAINQAKSKAWVAGTMFGLLALNQGILTATGSKQKINLSDPMKPDFLKFKAAGQDVAYGGAMISLARLPIRLAALREKGGSGKMAKLIYPDESMTSEVERYVRSQIAPVAQPLADVMFKGDYENRPLPKMPLSGPTLAMPKRLAARGEKPYTWKELTLDTVLPIPFEEPFKEVWQRGLGMSPEDFKRYGDAFAKSLVQGATGARVNQDTAPK
jgi:hypothetical protein